MPDTQTTLREQVARIMVGRNGREWDRLSDLTKEQFMVDADAVLAVFAERERLLRERIEALSAPYSADDIDSGHRRSREHYERAVRDVLAVFDAEH